MRGAGGDKSSDARRGSEPEQPMPGSRRDSRHFSQVLQHLPKRTQGSRSRQSPPSHPRGISQVPPGKWGCPRPRPGVTPAARGSSTTSEARVTEQPRTSAPPRWHPATRPAAGCLDFSQGKVGKCQNRNLLTKTGGVSIRAQPCDQVETLFTAVLGGKVV